MKYAIKSLKLLITKYPYSIFIHIISIAISVITTIIPIYIISRIISLYEANASVSEAFILIAIVAMIFLGCHLITLVTNYFNDFIERNFKAEISILFFKKLDSIDYDFHESPSFLNDYTRALETGTERIYQSANSVINIIRIFFQSFSVFTIIYLMHPIAVVYAILIGAVYLLIRFRIGKLNFRSQSEMRPYFRQRNYVNRTFFIKDAMADLKTTAIEEILLENNEIANNQIIKVIDTITLKVATLNFVGDVLISSIYPVTLGVLAYVMINNLVISEFAALTVAATSLSTLVSQFVRAIGDLQNQSVECKIPFEVLSMKSSIEGIEFESVHQDFHKLKLEDVSFSYEGTKKVLNNINMEINKGEKIAIVGSNGAGKTTLVKLLLRLYDASSGKIYINDQNYRNVTAKCLREKVGAVFQNVEVYAASIAENIIFRKPTTPEDNELVEAALKFSGLYDYVMSLDDGINTEITREFHRRGAIFSGGQMQRMAIARGYAQNYQLFILDEPSSALDPLAEAQVYQNMLTLGQEKTIVFISHRLTTTVNADKIYLFENGEIIESGTHQQLMTKNGVYKKMFVSQASKYLGDKYEDF